MFEQLENTLLNTLVEKLRAHGINADVDTIKKAITNSPQIIQEIESVLLSSATSQERLEKIKAIIANAAGTSTTTTTTTTTGTSDTKK